MSPSRACSAKCPVVVAVVEVALSFCLKRLLSCPGGVLNSACNLLCAILVLKRQASHVLESREIFGNLDFFFYLFLLRLIFFPFFGTGHFSYK